MAVYEKLMNVQTEIKAPKNLRNTFGNYNYRNAESICEAVKPFLKAQKLALRLEDSIELVADRVYVKATAILTDCETCEEIEVSAYARESLDKKGMDSSQVTGATSSYARKYALNGMFLLDDTKDADSDEYQTQTGNKKTAKEKIEDDVKTADIENMKISDVKVKILQDKCKADGIEEKKVLELYKVKSFKELTEKKFRNINENWEKIKDV